MQASWNLKHIVGSLLVVCLSLIQTYSEICLTSKLFKNMGCIKISECVVRGFCSHSLAWSIENVLWKSGELNEGTRYTCGAHFSSFGPKRELTRVYDVNVQGGHVRRYPFRHPFASAFVNTQTEQSCQSKPSQIYWLARWWNGQRHGKQDNMFGLSKLYDTSL